MFMEELFVGVGNFSGGVDLGDDKVSFWIYADLFLV